MTRPAELLRLAGILASDNDGSPRWVSRARAVSTIYYALFHALAEQCARDLVGASRPWLPFKHVYRSLDHGHARTVFDSVRRDGSFSNRAKELAAAFIALQAERHGADYDPGYRVTDAEVARMLTEARLAIEFLGSLEPAERKLIVAQLIGRARRT